MTTKSFSLPDVVDLHSARSVADGLLRHIRASTTPSVNTEKLRHAGVPLLQILVAARQFAEAQGKPFTVAAEPGGALAALLSRYGLDPALCGAPADLVPPVTDRSTQRT